MEDVNKIVFEVIRTRQFDRKAKKIWGAVDLVHNPESGAHLGGARIIYLLITDDHQIYLLDAYAKNEKSDLSQAEYKMLREVAENLRSTDNDKKKR